MRDPLASREGEVSAITPTRVRTKHPLEIRQKFRGLTNVGLAPEIVRPCINTRELTREAGQERRQLGASATRPEIAGREECLEMLGIGPH